MLGHGSSNWRGNISFVFSFSILRDKGAALATAAQDYMGSGVPGSEKAKIREK